MAAGEIDGDGKMEALVTRDEAGKTYRKLVLQGNAIIGAILLGDIRGSEEIQKAIKGKRDISALEGRASQAGFRFFSPEQGLRGNKKQTFADKMKTTAQETFFLRR